MKEQMNKMLMEQMGALAGALIYSIGVNIFIVPSGLYSGGVMGSCQLLRNLFLYCSGMELGQMDLAGIIYYAFNIPVFLLGIKILGKKYMASTIITVTAMSVFLSVIPIWQKPLMQNDLFVSSVLGGALAGVGIGMVLHYNSTMGGMDIISLFLMKKNRNISMGKVYLGVNILVYGICTILYSPRIGVYSLVYAVVSSFVMDKVYTQKINKIVFIVSKKNTTQLKNAILESLGRGTTCWQSTGAYTGEGETVLMTVLSKNEIPQLKKIVHETEQGAFLVSTGNVLVDGNYMAKW